MINDFYYRELLIQNAREVFIATGKTRNITDALRMYQDRNVAPDEQVPLFITSPEIGQIKTILERLRPACDECGNQLYLQTGAQNPYGEAFPSAWICKDCGMIYYSNKTPAEWLKELQDEDRKENLQNGNEPNREDVPA